MKNIVQKFIFVAAIVVAGPFAISATAQTREYWEDCGGLVDPGRVVNVVSACKVIAEQGNLLAQLVLGSMYDNGEGVIEDNLEAIKWYRLAADQGDQFAQFSLGVIYDIGDGVVEDNLEAYGIAWLPNRGMWKLKITLV